MPTAIFVELDGQSHSFDAPTGTSLMRAAVDAGVSGIVGECGGNLACATCHIYVDPAWIDALPPMAAEENAMLNSVAAERRATSRLACQISMADALDGIVLHVPPVQF